MDRFSSVRDQAYHFFIQEVPDLLQQLESGLLELGEKPTTHQVHTLMRLAHTIKGGSAGVGLDDIKEITHKLEDCLRALYSEDLLVDAELEMLFLLAYDCLRSSLEEIISLGQSNSSSEHLQAAVLVFDRLEQKLEGFLGEEDRLSSAAEYGVDIVRSIFEVDIQEGLERLESIKNEPHDVIRGELRAQAQVFLGIADLVDTKVLEEIATLVIEILDKSPNTIEQLLPLALADFRSVQQAFLANASSIDNLSPSGELQNLLSLDDQEAETFSLFEEPAAAEMFSLFEEPAAAEMFSLEAMFEEEPVVAETLSLEEEPVVADILSLEAMFEEEPVAAEIFSLKEPTAADMFSLEAMFEEEPAAEPLMLSIEDAILQITENFNTLESIDSDQIIKTPLKREEPITVPASIATTEPEISVRLELSRLESMNNQLGELSINRSRLSIQQERIRGALNELNNRFTSFKEIEPKLKNVLDKLSIGPIHSNTNLQPPQFDVLELDNYSAAYEILQYAVEQLIQLEEALEDAVLYTERSTESIDKQKQILKILQNDFLRARMLPLGTILNRFTRILRDLSVNYHKPVELTISGTNTLTDKAVLEKLYDPLLHLVRNAFDHGIESPEERQTLGKTPEGHISIEAYSRGNRTFIKIKDDGRGINPERIRTKVIESNIIPKETAQTLSNSQLFNFLFAPGFSTAATVTELSGRGMGLDIVDSQIRSLKGEIYIDSTINKGTVFTLSLPLTVSMTKLLVISAENALLAISSESIERILVPLGDQIKSSAGQRFLFLQEQLIPIYSVKELITYASPTRRERQSDVLDAISQPAHWLKPLIIFLKEGQLTALEIDQIITEQELVIKPLNTALKTPDYMYGCTIIGEGTLVPVVDGLSLLNKRERKAVISSTVPYIPATQKEDTILIVDDSAGMRQTLTLTLEKFGYSVLQASDGRVALEQVQSAYHEIKLVICDIEMPNMNGFEFLTHCRNNPAIQKIPIMMLTSRSSDKHRNLATQLGAVAYMTKPYLETDLLAQVEQLVGT